MNGMAVLPRMQAVAETPAMLQVQVCDSTDQMQALGREWHELLARCPQADLFMTHAWHAAWWRAFGRQHRPHVLAVRRGQRLVAVLPLMIYRDRFRGLPVRVLGSYNNEHASRSGLLVEPGQEAATAEALAKHVAGCQPLWDVLLLRHLPRDAAWLQPLWQACAGEGLTVYGPTAGKALRVLPLQGGWDDYLGARGGHFRKRLRENLRRVERVGKVTYRESQGGAADFETFVQLESGSWKQGDDNARLGPEGWAFQREVAAAAEAGIRCHNQFLEIDGRVVGGVHSVGYRGAVYAVQTLFDESVRDVYAGRAQMATQIARMFAEGRYDRFDFNGDSPFCRSWTDQALEFVDLQIYSRRPYPALLSWLKQRLGRRR